jgi:hypothetical protein
MRRLKAFGERIASRDPDRQAAEIHTRIALVNRFPALGQAETARVACSKGERGNLGLSRVTQQRLHSRIRTDLNPGPRSCWVNMSVRVQFLKAHF